MDALTIRAHNAVMRDCAHFRRTRIRAVIQPGKSAVLLVTLKHGAYSLWCPVPGHAARGMKATLTTPGASGGGTTTTTSATTSTGTTGETTTIDVGY